MLDAAFAFLADNPRYVRLMRREAIDAGTHVRIDLPAVLRPYFQSAAAYLRGEMDAGTFRPHDAEQLLVTGYGAVLSYFSDDAFIGGLLGATRSARTISPAAGSTSPSSSGPRCCPHGAVTPARRGRGATGAACRPAR